MTLISRGHCIHRGVLTSGGWIRGVPGVLTSGCWNRGVPLYTEVSSFQGCWNRGVPLYTEVSSFQGVGIKEFHCIHREVRRLVSSSSELKSLAFV